MGTAQSTASKAEGAPQEGAPRAAGLKEEAIALAIDGLMLYGMFLATKYLYKSIRPLIDEILHGEQSRSRLHRRLERSGRAAFRTNHYEDVIAGDLVDPRDLDVTFADIGGLEQQKRDIYDLVVLPLKCPEFFQSRGALLTVPKGILLYGQPGTGKTMLAKAIAKESGAFFIDLRISTIMSKWFGESQKLVRAAFSLAQKLAPCIIFIDEVDAFMGKRGALADQTYSLMKTEFMALWDGFTQLSSSEQGFGVIVMGATNRPGDVDPAFLRRMPRAFDIGLPTRRQREKILQLLLRDEELNPDLDLAELSRVTAYFSGSDLKELCRAALMIPLREHIERVRSQVPQPENAIVQGDENAKIAEAPVPKVRALSKQDFEEARTMVQPTGDAAQEYESKARGRRHASQSPSANDVDPELFTALMAASMQHFMAQYMQPRPA